MIRKEKILLVVNIITHYRIMNNLAAAIERSGKFEPVIAEYWAVGPENGLNRAGGDGYRTYLYDGGRFTLKPYAAATSERAAQGAVRRIREAGRPFRSIAAGFLEGAGRLCALALELRFLAAALRDAVVDGGLRFRPEDWRATIRTLALREFASVWERHAMPAKGGRESIVAAMKGRVMRCLPFDDHGQARYCMAFEELLDREKPALVIMPEENLFYNGHLVVYSARKRDIPFVVVPFTVANATEWACAFYPRREYWASRGWNRVLASAFPSWTMQYKGRTLLLPKEYILCAEFLGVAPASPWTINSGFIDGLAAESELMLDYYLKAGIGKDIITLTGALSDDVLYHGLANRNETRSRLLAASGLSGAKKIVLVSLPPDQFPAGVSREVDFRSYRELLSFIIAAVDKKAPDDCAILLCLHPRIAEESLEGLALGRAVIVRERVENLIPISDIFIAVASAVIRMAIACGVPCVNFDAYHYKYDEYRGCRGVASVDSRDDYERVCDSLMNNEDFYKVMSVRQAETSRAMCPLDGRAESRLLEMFERVIAAKKKPLAARNQARL